MTNTPAGTITSGTNLWSTPERIEVNEVGQTIEMIYHQTSLVHYSTSPLDPNQSHRRVFKIIYSCVHGKWHKSEPIYGKIIPAQSESYEF